MITNNNLLIFIEIKIIELQIDDVKFINCYWSHFQNKTVVNQYLLVNCAEN